MCEMRDETIWVPTKGSNSDSVVIATTFMRDPTVPTGVLDEFDPEETSRHAATPASYTNIANPLVETVTEDS